MTPKSFGNIFMILGLMSFVMALAWWLLFFEQMLGTSVKMASKCFYYTTTECQIVNAIELFFEIPKYSPALLWMAIGLFGGGLLIHALSGPEQNTNDGTEPYASSDRDG